MADRLRNVLTEGIDLAQHVIDLEMWILETSEASQVRAPHEEREKEVCIGTTEDSLAAHDATWKRRAG